MIHRAHDYAHLVRRWRAVAKRARLELEPIATAAGFEILMFDVPRANGGLYLSAGIHGDEPASTEGLIAWAERQAATLARLPVTIFPCLNPWGLVQNLRMNEAGLDLNRMFDRDEPVTLALRERLRGRRFDAALTLHEDYDGQGIYLYEGLREAPFWGEALLARASRFIPIDPRPRIDLGRPKHGVIRRRFDARRYVKLGGLPEAVYLHQRHARRTITFETPSEFALDRRVAAQVAVIEACLEHVLA